jgi:hypothetical protein
MTELLSEVSRANLVDILRHSLKNRNDGRHTTIRATIPSGDVEKLVNLFKTPTDGRKDVSACLEIAIRRSITEVAQGGVMNAIDVLFDELDGDEMEELVDRIRHNLRLLDVTTEEVAEGTGSDFAGAGVEAAPASPTLDKGDLDIAAIKAAIAADLGIDPDQITFWRGGFAN